MSPPAPAAPIGPSHPADHPELWDQLDQFLTQLQGAADVHTQLRSTLEVIRAGARADVVFLFSARSSQVTEMCGSPDDRTTFARVAEELLADAGSGDAQLLRPRHDSTWFPRPLSIAMLRLSRSRGIWVGAVRLDVATPLMARDLRLMGLTRRLLVQHQSQQQSQEQLRDMLFGLVRCLTAALDARDPYTWGHSERVARIAVRLAEHIRLPQHVQSELYLGGMLHDVGKIGVPDQVLRKPGRLTEDEMALVRKHVTIGDAIVGHVRQLAHLRPIVRHHHEQFDGRGYPDRLSGEEIPILARITAVADACDAMMADRPYRKGLAPAQIEEVFREGNGTQWDPDIVAAFFACRQEIYSIGQRGLGESMLLAIANILESGEESAGAVHSFRLSCPVAASATTD